MVNCKNCGALISGKFCNECGQKASVGELTLHELVHEFWHSVTHTDKGILRLLKDLALHPKSVYLNYFSGQRKKYFSPVTFFLVAAALLIFTGIKVFDYQDQVLKTNNEFGRFLFSETKFRTLLILPVQVLLTRLLFFRQYNLAKNIVFWLFLNGFLFSIKLVFTPLYFLFISYKDLLDNIIQLLLYFVTLVHLWLVFGKKKWFHVISCLVVVYILLMADYILSGYLIYGNKLMEKTGSHSIIELVNAAFRWQW